MTWYVPNDAGTVKNAATTVWHLPHSAIILNFLDFQWWSFAVVLARVSTWLTHHTKSPSHPKILPTNFFLNQTSHCHYALVDIVIQIWLFISVMVPNRFQEELSMLCTDTVHLSNNILWSIFFLMIAPSVTPFHTTVRKIVLKCCWWMIFNLSSLYYKKSWRSLKWKAWQNSAMFSLLPVVSEQCSTYPAFDRAIESMNCVY